MDSFQYSNDLYKAISSARDAVPAAYKLNDKLAGKAESYESSANVYMASENIYGEGDILNFSNKFKLATAQLESKLVNILMSDNSANANDKAVNKKKKQKLISAAIKAYEQIIERGMKILMEARAEKEHTRSVTQQARAMYGPSLAASQPDSSETLEAIVQLETAYVANSEDTLATA
jgi:hypothetical protein